MADFYQNTSVSKTKRPQTPEQEGETSASGHMSDPESDDDVDQLDKPFQKDEDDQLATTRTEI